MAQLFLCRIIDATNKIDGEHGSKVTVPYSVTDTLHNLRTALTNNLLNGSGEPKVHIGPTGFILARELSFSNKLLQLYFFALARNCTCGRFISKLTMSA